MAFLKIAADDQDIYAVTGDGALLWYRDDLRDGTNGPHFAGWATASGNRIGAGWHIFRHLFCGGGGVIYGITDAGALRWYRDDLRNGGNGPNAERGWAPGSGNQVGAGWHIFRHVFSGGDGVIYAITQAGGLRWYRDDLRDGTNGPNAEQGWAPGSGNQIGYGWQDFDAVFAPGTGDGIIYAVLPTSDLLWYRDDLRDGTNGPGAERGWAPGRRSAIGVGWAIEPPALISGYPAPLSVSPGDTVDIRLSARNQISCSVTVMRLRENADGSVGVPVGTAVDVVVARQAASTDAWRLGCGWPTAVAVAVDPAWPSGLYTARVAAQDGSGEIDVVFVVRPGAVKRDFLLLANTNCWNAYNTWGGVSNYTGQAEVVTLSFERPNPSAAPSALENGVYVRNHLTAAEIWLSTWLEDTGYQVDTCSDLDFHNGDPDPNEYKAVILSTHPEYWSLDMAERLSDYVASGGKLLYLGGNGIFRRVLFTAGGRAMTTGFSTAWYCGNAWPNGPKPRQLLGVAYDILHDLLYPASCGYVIEQPDHRFFAGTGLSEGDIIGTEGRNGGGACGWEVDTAIDFGEGNGPPPSELEILAHGELVTGAGYTGHMTYYENDAGGFVFSIGSLTVGGSLPIDQQLQRIVSNALDAC